jgi:predicted DNA binding CopG/RHH family protein
MKKNLDVIIQQAKHLINDPDYVIKLIDLSVVYFKKDFVANLEFDPDNVGNANLFEIMEFDLNEDMSQVMATNQDSNERVFNLRIPQSPIESIRIQTQDFTVDGQRYRVGKVLEYISKQKDVS